MIHILNDFFYIVAVFYIAYLFLYATFLFLSVSVGAYKLYKQDRMVKLRNELTHDYYVPISLLVPAYNEEVTIVDNVKSLLNLDYRLYEIIVVDDGSNDGTSEKLIGAFDMHPYNRPIRRVINCRPHTEIYEARRGPVKLTLIRKENGGKGDALNMGINASQYPYYICIDADSMLQRDSLTKIAQPVLEDDSIVAVGGLIRVAQCVEMEDGEVKGYNLPTNFIIGMQVVEYDRSFLGSRILMDLFNGNLIVSGAFGMFKKSTVVGAGGYSSDSLGEDMEIIVKMHVFCRNNNQKYRIRYEPNAICWSQVPSSLIDLTRQRRRWNLGLFQSMFAYRQIFSNLRFGLVSFISYLYYLMFELLSPFIELFGILTVIIASAFGILNVRFMIIFFCLYSLYGAVLSATAFYQRIFTQNFRVKPVDLLRVFLMCFTEIIFFRYVLTVVRLFSYVRYKKRRTTWGNITRTHQRANTAD